jgi:hypothetical protein
VILAQVGAGVLVLVLHWEQLRLLRLLESLPELLVLLRQVPVRQEQIQLLVGVDLGDRYVAAVLVQLHVDAGRLLLPDLVIELALGVVYEAVVRQLVLVEAGGHVLPTHRLAVWVLVLRH